MLCSQFLDVNSSSWNTALMLWLLFLQGKRHAQKVRLYFLNKELEEMAYKKRADQKAERIHSRVRFPLSPVFPYFEFYLVFQWRVVASSFMGILISEKLVFVWHLWGCKGGGVGALCGMLCSCRVTLRPSCSSAGAVGNGICGFLPRVQFAPKTFICGRQESHKWLASTLC